MPEFLLSLLLKERMVLISIMLLVTMMNLRSFLKYSLLTMFRDVRKAQIAKMCHLLYKVRDRFSGEMKRGVWMDEEHRGR